MDDLIEEGFPIPTDIVVHEDCFVYCFDMTNRDWIFEEETHAKYHSKSGKMDNTIQLERGLVWIG